MTTALVESLWATYHDRLWAFIRGRVANTADAEDLVQEVFLRVHRHLCCSPDWQRPEAWFYQIARNLIVDYYRRRREWVGVPDDLPAAPEEIAGWADDPEAELALTLKETVLALPEPYRQALILTEYDGLSQVEMAERLGISHSAAKSRVQRARQKLRDLVLECCHVEFDRQGRVLDYSRRCCCCNPRASQSPG